MSSAATATAAAATAAVTAAAGGAVEPQLPAALTLWCHVCDMGVSVPPSPSSSPSPLLCPHCSGGSLEQMESPAPQPLTASSSSTDSDSSGASTPVHQHLHRLIDTLPSIRTSTSPAPRSSIDALPTVPVPSPGLLCAVCKDDLPLASPALRLPCTHLYHPDCILPWLSLRNSCPLCRAPIPVSNLLRADTELHDSLRRIVRRHQMASLLGWADWPTTSRETETVPSPLPSAQNGQVGGGDGEGGAVMSDASSWEYFFD